ncbi:MAG: 4-(cytidine 5'-diphospho)-2-C-methyl-D-erythritol kinase [Mariprofundaceae bacterium]|nr:4-(cytidine 5'-diphospho)-2-C-methyl-D-erythritol kinase [Mariprofundaceae bacterium]
MTTLLAPAKVNLHLHITGLTDEGYHLLDTSFAYIDCYDALHIEAANELSVTCSESVLNGPSNLVYHVLHALREKFAPGCGLRVHVEKHLPAQAGLGGGSSDAATALLAANKLWGLDLTSRELSEFASSFGADIPCFLFGQSSQASGIGEQLTPLCLGHGAQPVVLAHPGVGLSTPLVFSHFDKLEMHKKNPFPSQLTPSRAKATMRAGLTGEAMPLLPLGENDLEAVSIEMCPELALLLAAMRSKQLASWMSGSGTACIAFCESAAQADDMAQYLITERLANWTHAGMLLDRHPLYGSSMQPSDWGVAKR